MEKFSSLREKVRFLAHLRYGICFLSIVIIDAFCAPISFEIFLPLFENIICVLVPLHYTVRMSSVHYLWYMVFGFLHFGWLLNDSMKQGTIWLAFTILVYSIPRVQGTMLSSHVWHMSHVSHKCGSVCGVGYRGSPCTRIQLPQPEWSLRFLDNLLT